MEIFWEVLAEGFLDTCKMLPFLLLAYLLIEWIEHSAKDNLVNMLSKMGPWGPVGGAVLGCVPQCGFSAAAANLYAGGLITVGTLGAVFIATSDEAVPIFLAHPDKLWLLGLLLISKLVLGSAAGLMIDGFSKLKGRGSVRPDFKDMCSGCHCNERGIFYSALTHTLEIGIFILILNLLLTGLFTLLGVEPVMAFLQKMGPLQPLLAGVVGLIPNCAASVLLTELYLQGGLSFGALLAGLGCGAGVGTVVLFRSNRGHLKKNIGFIGLIMVISIGAGYLADVIFKLF